MRGNTLMPHFPFFLEFKVLCVTIYHKNFYIYQQTLHGRYFFIKHMFDNAKLLRIIKFSGRISRLLSI